MSVDEIAKPGKTEESGILSPSVEKKISEINENEVGIGVDDAGFWHFVIHSKKGVHSILGFLELSKDTVKAHYIGQAQAAAAEKQRKGLLRPEHINGFVDRVKGKFRR